jgi:DNA-binding CsgD family transcriptional regulator
LSTLTSHSFASAIAREFNLGTSAPGLILLSRQPAGKEAFADLYRVLAKHFKRALELQRRMKELESHQENVHSSLEHLPMGIMLLDERLLIRYANTSARRILNAKDGLMVSQGMLVARDRQEAVQLGEALHHAVWGKNGGEGQESATLWISRSCGKRPIGLVICRAENFDDNEERQCPIAVFLNDPEQPIFPAPEFLIRLYGFTRAEALLTQQLLQGKSISQGARSLKISQNTARTHLKRILQKTDTKRQADLMRLLLTGPASLIP